MTVDYFLEQMKKKCDNKLIHEELYLMIKYYVDVVKKENKILGDMFVVDEATFWIVAFYSGLK